MEVTASLITFKYLTYLYLIIMYVSRIFNYKEFTVVLIYTVSLITRIYLYPYTYISLYYF